MTRDKHDGFGPVRRKTFLNKLRNTSNVRAACEAAHISRQAAYNAKNNEPDFALLWEEALEDAVELLEAKAWNNAMKKDSETSLWNLLKAHRPQKYRDTSRQEIGGEMTLRVIYDNGHSTTDDNDTSKNA